MDSEKIDTYKQVPDKNAGRCDKCDCSQFKSRVEDGKFYRTCRDCGYTKIV